MGDEVTEPAAEETPVVYDQEQEPQERTFSQSDVERIIKERFEKFSDYDALREKASKLDEIEEAQKSELEKLAERAERAEAERDQIAETARQQKVRAAVIAEASRQGAIDPEDIVALLSSKSLVNDDGEVEGVDAAVSELLESKPHLAGSRTPKPADQGARATAPEDDDPVAELGRKILRSAAR